MTFPPITSSFFDGAEEILPPLPIVPALDDLRVASCNNFDLLMLRGLSGVSGVKVVVLGGRTGGGSGACIPATTDAAVVVAKPTLLLRPLSKTADPLVGGDVSVVEFDRKSLAVCPDLGGMGAAAGIIGGGFGGSSYDGGGKMGFALALPVPEGPPPPTLRRAPATC